MYNATEVKRTKLLNCINLNEVQIISPALHKLYRMGHKNVALYFCPYLRQLMTDFQNSFTDTLCAHFAIM